MGALSPESRETILKIKAAVHRHNQYKRAFGAKHIYDAVLNGAVRDVEGFAAHLDKTMGLRIAV